jgi:hypothetical protein
MPERPEEKQEFSAVPTKLEIDEMKAALAAVAAEHRGTAASERIWTGAIKLALCRVGNAFGFHTCAECGAAKHQQEWLYDLAWLRCRDGDPAKGVDDVALVMKCAWLMGCETDREFDKLVVARTSLRLMVFQVDHAPDFAEASERLLGRAEKFRRRNADRYLFAAYSNEQGRFLFREVVVP